jgi:hypothetical protein
VADVYGPFAGGTWSDGEWSRFAPTWVSSGPILAAGASVPSSATTGEWAFSSSGLSVSAGTGRAWVRGFGITRTGTPPSHAVTANTHASWSRRDRLVLRRDLAAGTITTAVKAGTAAASPTAPSLTQSETGVWEETLFSFLTPPNSGTSITGIVDERKWVSPSGNGSIIKPEPTAATDYATKGYVDTAAAVYAAKSMRAQRNVDQTLADGTWVGFSSNTNWGELDPWLMRSTGATWVAKWDGWYHLVATIYFAPHPSGARGMRLMPLDGQGIGEGAGMPYELATVGAAPTPHSVTITGSHITNLLTGQRVQLEGYQSSGAPLIVRSVRISAVYLGPNT